MHNGLVSYMGIHAGEFKKKFAPIGQKPWSRHSKQILQTSFLRPYAESLMGKLRKLVDFT